MFRLRGERSWLGTGTNGEFGIVLNLLVSLSVSLVVVQIHDLVTETTNVLG